MLTKEKLERAAELLKGYSETMYQEFMKELKRETYQLSQELRNAAHSCGSSDDTGVERGYVLLDGKRCPKCNNGSLKLRWGSRCGGWNTMCNDNKVSAELRRNHIHVTCRVCLYEWLEKPLDFEEG